MVTILRSTAFRSAAFIRGERLLEGGAYFMWKPKGVALGLGLSRGNTVIGYMNINSIRNKFSTMCEILKKHL